MRLFGRSTEQRFCPSFKQIWGVGEISRDSSPS
ncbi:hypothetical protein DO72_5809 [Burkholderia pseudomallei]|nr:hypothetical protein DO72_5809 [Burkholderia pseudomallei]